ncbi:MAG: hypothetical protein K5694_06800 [Bacilli bacterium]|nr:hypothetical protein [Bacilli bacterium]
MKKVLISLLSLTSVMILGSCGHQAAPEASSSKEASSSSASSEATSEVVSSAESSAESVSSSSASIADHPVTVNFYVDYNAYSESIRNIYHTENVDLGDKLVAPTTPEAPFTDFPNFLGWSTKTLIEDPADLWDFDNDVVYTKDSTLVIYGIWGA